MNNRTNKIGKLIVILSSVILVMTIIYYYAFCDIQRLKGQKELCESTSPNGDYTVTAYLNDGGATTDYAVLCTLVDNHDGYKRNIYWKYHCDNADIKWLDNNNIEINNVKMNALKDTYDYRRDK